MSEPADRNRNDQKFYAVIVSSDEVSLEVEPDLPDAECHWRQKAADHG